MTDMRKCRNWQTSKTKDLVLIASVWVQVPSSALEKEKREPFDMEVSSFLYIVRARPCFQDGVFRVPKNGMLETNKPLAMRVVGNTLAYRKNLQCYNNAGSPTTLQAEEVSIWI